MTHATPDLDLDATREALHRLARRLAPAPQRPPLSTHLILGSRRAVEGHFGAAAFAALDAALTELAQASGGSLVWLDDPISAAAAGSEPLDDAANPADWDAWLAAAAPATRSVLIVGGPAVAPFGLARNPSDDDDGLLATDVMVAGARPMEPQRAVGRLPDAGDAAYLLRLVRATTEAHQAARARASRWSPLGRVSTPTAIGYTASIWRHAARVVFASLDSPQRLRMSPPLDHEHAPIADVAAFSPAYFNLHGLRDDANWYGQRDPLLAADYPAFPLALRIDQISPAVRRRLIVFSAACYGAHIEAKSAANSMALRMLDTQAAAFVGSTAVAYGGLGEPLQATDQLALLFWQAARAGLPLGEALRQAKLGLVAEMQRRQNYVDSEDQKAVLSFVLYGDPSLRPFATLPWSSQAAGAPTTASAATDATLRVARPVAPDNGLPAPLLQRVERDIRARLPDLGPVRVHATPTPYPKSPDGRTQPMTLTVVEEPRGRPFRQLVKVTLNADGAIAKLVMAHG